MRIVSRVLVLVLAFGSTFNVAYIEGRLAARCDAGQYEGNGNVFEKQGTKAFSLLYGRNCLSDKIWFGLDTKGIEV